MASYKISPTLIIDDIAWYADRIEREMFHGSQEGTRIKLVSTSGTLDPFTEEITYHQTESWHNASGIVGTVTEQDALLGPSGRVKVGDLKVTYPYPVISGILYKEIETVEIVTPFAGASGVYYVGGMYIDILADRPLTVDLGLTLDRNG